MKILHEIEKVTEQAYAFQLSTRQHKNASSCSKCGLSCPQKFVPQFLPLHFRAADSMSCSLSRPLDTLFVHADTVYRYY